MLQQTRVETVIPYFVRFMNAFPTVAALAAAPLEELLKQWSGLGYYRRAHQLAAAADLIVARHGGALPKSVAELSTLPGIGAYTAGAIASIAFDRQAAIVDGNVARVLARLFSIELDLRRGAGRRAVWSLAAELVPARRPGRFNQGLMELGATLCSVRAPRCGDCPVRRWCLAFVSNRQAELPLMSPPKAARTVALYAALVVHETSGRLLLARRRPEGLFGGLWEPPMVAAADRKRARARLGQYGIAARTRLRARPGRTEHKLTHRRLQVSLLTARAERRWRLPVTVVEPYDRLAWSRPEQMPLSVLAQKLLAKAGEQRL